MIINIIFKSIFETANFGYNGGTILGRNLLSSDMLEYVKSETVESKDAAAIKEESIANPSVLLGWQVIFQSLSNIPIAFNKKTYLRLIYDLL